VRDDPGGIVEKGDEVGLVLATTVASLIISSPAQVYEN
jgi:hypothetical protein